MPRVKGGVTTRRRHKKLFKLTKGYKYGRKNLQALASRASAKAGLHAYVGRKLRKRDFRRLWIARLNAAVRAKGIRYSQFIDMLTKKRVLLNRKVLSEMAIETPEVFAKIFDFAQSPPQTEHKLNGVKKKPETTEEKTPAATKKPRATKTTANA